NEATISEYLGPMRVSTHFCKQKRSVRASVSLAQTHYQSKRSSSLRGTKLVIARNEATISEYLGPMRVSTHFFKQIRTVRASVPLAPNHQFERTYQVAGPSLSRLSAKQMRNRHCEPLTAKLVIARNEAT